MCLRHLKKESPKITDLADFLLQFGSYHIKQKSDTNETKQKISSKKFNDIIRLSEYIRTTNPFFSVLILITFDDYQKLFHGKLF